jgi:2Fe-2S ferredoxin
MPRVVFIVDGVAQQVEFNPGELADSHHGRHGSLLDIARHFHVPLEHACGGSCACTTCHVIIKDGMEHLSEMEDDEADRLETAWDVTPQSRLGCQALVNGDVVCEIPMYTRNYVQEGGGIRLGRTAQGKIPLEEVKS